MTAIPEDEYDQLTARDYLEKKIKREGNRLLRRKVCKLFWKHKKNSEVTPVRARHGFNMASQMSLGIKSSSYSPSPTKKPLDKLSHAGLQLMHSVRYQAPRFGN